MNKAHQGLVCMLAFAVFFCAGSLFSGDSSKPEINVTTESERPSGELRSVSTSDVQAAMERIRAEREKAEKGSPSTPPAAAKTPAPLATPPPKKSEIELRAEEIRASIAQNKLKSQAPDPDLPDWTPAWKKKQSTPARRGRYCEVNIVCEWKGVFVSVVLAPDDEKLAPIRVLVNTPSAELIDMAPGTRKVVIEGWLPSQQAPVPIHRLETKKFEQGERYTLTLSSKESAAIKEFLSEAEEQRKEALAAKKEQSVFRAR